MMELRNVEMYFGKQHILKNTNLQIKEQKITALIGANGAGKSTLFDYDFHIREVDGKKVCVYPSGRSSSVMS